MNLRNNNWIAFGPALLLAALVYGCSDQKPEAVSAPQPVATHVAPSATSPAVSEAVVPNGVLVTGPLIVEHQVDVTAQRDGVVDHLYADSGERVTTGTVLARLDDRQLKANLDSARAKTRSVAADLKNWQAESEVLKADYARAQRLYDAKVVSEEQLQHAKYKSESDQWDIQRVTEELNGAKDQERALELEVEKTQVSAPFAGVIARRYVREGQSVSKGDRLFWITAEGPLRIRFTLPEKYIGHVKRGQELPLISPDVPSETHTVKIVEISPVVDPSSGTIEILAELTGARGELRPGMTATVHFAGLQ